MQSTRRGILVGALAALPALGSAGPPLPATGRRMNRAMPEGATDCHTHVFLDQQRFPMDAGRRYTPPLATPVDLAAANRQIGIQRRVIVTPSVYGTDNRATGFSIASLGQETTRGVAVIDGTTSPEEIRHLHSVGFRGVRINAGFDPHADVGPIRAQFQRTLEQLMVPGWHIQIYADLRLLVQMSDLIESSRLPVVLDHFAGLTLTRAGNKAEFHRVLEWLRLGHVWVKLSGAYIVANIDDGFAAAQPYARALVAANPDRIVWGSDWPHPGFDHAVATWRANSGLAPALHPRPGIKERDLIELLFDWVPSRRLRRRILVDNPAQLYGFRP